MRVWGEMEGGEQGKRVILACPRRTWTTAPRDVRQTLHRSAMRFALTNCMGKGGRTTHVNGYTTRHGGPVSAPLAPRPGT